MKPAWPSTLWIVRHGESAGNVARDKAMLEGLSDISIDLRDADVPLSSLGKQQSISLGKWFADLPAESQPNVILTSPYIRARQTAEDIRRAGGLSDSVQHLISDERLREKEFGILDRLTRVGIEKQHPSLADARALVGKFYFRPPGGGKLVRCHSSAPKCAGHNQPSLPRPACARSNASSRCALHAIPAGESH